jgi:protein-arginine deiminase
MALLRTTAISQKDLSEKAWGSIVIREGVARDKVRIFRNESNEWVFTPNYHKFKREELTRGLELGIDARDTRRPGCWDGRAEVYFFVHDYDVNGNIAWNAVRLRVAPVLTHHHAQRLEKLVSVAGNDTDINQERFIANVTKALDDTVKVPLFLFNHSDDVWAQDFLEPGYTSMPGPNGTVTLRVMLRSPQKSRVAGRQVFEYLRETGVGAVYHPCGSRDELDSMGNLETIPPYTYGNKNYPAGRIVEGSHGLANPHILDYMRAQEFQDPLVISTDWLLTGHVDEVVQFLPTKKVTSKHGWVVVISDHKLGKQKLEAIGNKTIKAFSRPYGTPDLTVEELLKGQDVKNADKIMPPEMDKIIGILKSETGINDSDIYHVPSVFGTNVCSPPDDGVAPERNCSSNYVTALYPDIVNGVVLSDHQYLSADPWGPIVNGEDVIKNAASEVYDKLGYNVTYIDDWESHHILGGEVHCGSNSIRQVGDGWWKGIREQGKYSQNSAGQYPMHP